MQDSDASHYFGANQAVTIEKFTNLDPADTPTGPLLAVGDPVTWRYLITNTGNLPLINWQPTDNQGASVACPLLFFLVPGQTITCFSGGTVRAGQYANIGTVNASGPAGPVPPATDPAHYFGAQGNIQIEKLTNGEDADQAPGPSIPVGGLVTWTYQVTNTGNITVNNVAVVDLRAVAVSCPATTLAPLASMTCTATGTADPDQYTNLAFVTGETPLGQTVRDDDPSHYFGAAPGVLLQKHTNGVDADEAPGPFIPVGEPVDWTYIVTNTGNVALSGIAVTDNRGVAVTCPATTLAIDAEMTCTATGVSQLGQYANIGSVTATAAGGVTFTDTDPSHYFGSVSRIDVEKATNGEDADAAPGPSIPAGGSVTWTYRVTNLGNVVVRRIVVVDDRGVVPSLTGGDADGDGELDPGEIWTYQATGTAVAGQYRNVATVDRRGRARERAHGRRPVAPLRPEPGKPTADGDADPADHDAAAAGHVDGPRRQVLGRRHRFHDDLRRLDGTAAVRCLGRRRLER